MKILFISLLFILVKIAWSDKDVSGVRQSAVFSASSNPYQIDQQSLTEPGQTRQTHSAAQSQNSFGFAQDVQGKQFGQSSSLGFAASGSADASAGYPAYPTPQKPAYPDSGYSSAPVGAYPSSVSSYAPPPSVGGGYPASVGSSYAPPPSVMGGYPASQPKGQYGQPTQQYGQPASTGESYAYHYQHYPQQSHQSEYGSDGHSHSSSSIFDGDLFSGLSSLGQFGGEEGLLGGLGGLGGGLGGLGGGGSGGIAAAAGLKAIKALKGIAIVAKIAKHVLLVKPLIIFGLLLLIALPFIILFLPIPVITIVNDPGTPAAGTTRASNQQILSSYMTDLTSKVFSAEECLERIICKLPEVPEKYRGKAKGLWEEFGNKYITNTRVTRGLGAYFDESTGEPSKNRTFKCNQKFKCSNKFF